MKAMVLGTLNIGLFFTCLFAAAYRIPGSMAALLLASQSVWVLLLSRWWLGTGFSMTAAMQCGLGMVGVVLLLNPGQGGLDMTGVGIALLGAISMAAGIVLSKRWQRPPDVGRIEPDGLAIDLRWTVVAPPGRLVGRHTNQYSSCNICWAMAT